MCLCHYSIVSLRMPSQELLLAQEFVSAQVLVCQDLGLSIPSLFVLNQSCLLYGPRCCASASLHLFSQLPAFGVKESNSNFFPKVEMGSHNFSLWKWKKKIKEAGNRPTTALFYFANTVIENKPENRKAESGGSGFLWVFLQILKLGLISFKVMKSCSQIFYAFPDAFYSWKGFWQFKTSQKKYTKL